MLSQQQYVIRQLLLLLLLLLPLYLYAKDSSVRALSAQRDRDRDRDRDSGGAQWREQQKQKQSRLRNAAKTAKASQRLAVENRRAQREIESSTTRRLNSTFWHSQFRFESFAGPAVPMSESEGRGTPCSFSMADCQMEILEHRLVRRFVKPTDGVVEFGGRFGTTSCVIAANQNNSGKLIVVEPDALVWFILEENRRKHSCSFWTFQGSVSESKMLNVVPAAYATRTLPQQGQGASYAGVSNTVSLKLLRSWVTFPLNVLLFDCEGCIETVFFNATLLDMKNSLSETNTVIIEADMSIKDPLCKVGCVDYGKWFKIFEILGFSIVVEEPDFVYKNILHIVFIRK